MKVITLVYIGFVLEDTRGCHTQSLHTPATSCNL